MNNSSKNELWGIVKPIVAYGSLALNLALIGSWSLFAYTIEKHEDAQMAFYKLWPFDYYILAFIAIFLGIFSCIYFARTKGVWPKIWLVIQILLVHLFAWGLL